MIDCGYSNLAWRDSWVPKLTPSARMTKKVKLAIVQHDTTLTKLAGQIGVSGPFLSMLLAGKRRSAPTLAALAQHLGLSVSALQREIPTPKEAPYVTRSQSLDPTPEPAAAQPPCPTPARDNHP